MKVVALAGGTGSAKLLKGLAPLSDLTVVANVGDNFWFHGLYVCPDVDIATYSLAGISDGARGWGIRGDTFSSLGQLEALGEETWFRLGDRDMATSLARTDMLLRGRSLTEVTSTLARALKVEQRILPSTDSVVKTTLVTRSGPLSLQEFWVRDGGRPKVSRVLYRGARSAAPTKEVERAIAEADKVILCPGNPVTSMGPILAVSGMKRILTKRRADVVALSPMVGTRPYSGPAGALMKQLGMRVDSVGIAKLYSGFLGRLVIDRKDRALAGEVEAVGVQCEVADTLMRTSRDRRRLASVLLRA